MTPKPPGNPIKHPDGRYQAIIVDEASGRYADNEAGRGIAVIYGPTFLSCQRRAECVYRALLDLAANDSPEEST